MSIEGDTSNLRAPEERNVYSKSRSVFLKPQRGDMCIEYQHPKSPKAPEGRHVSKHGFDACINP